MTEARLARRITIPRQGLEKLDLDFFRCPTVSITSLLQFNEHTRAPQIRQRQVRVSSKLLMTGGFM
jgi:hypothetical protein